MKKSKEQILESILNRLQESTAITETTPGSVARTFSEVLSEEFRSVYDQVDLSSAMSFVSTATGDSLDMLGALLNCKRNIGESDTNYKNRIVNQVYIVAGANRTSIRLSALSVTGVKDIVLREYTHGIGSFTAYVITDEYSNPRTVLSKVEDVINEKKAEGVYAEVRTPVLIPTELMVRLIFSNKASDTQRLSIRSKVKKSIESYIANLPIGGTLIPGEIVRNIMDENQLVHDVDIYGLAINGINRFVGATTASNEERFLLDSLEVM